MTDNELAAYVTLFITSGVTISIVAASWFRYLGRKRQAEALSRGAPRESDDRLARIEQAVDAMAIEVERISEGQRFTTKLLADATKDRHALSGRSTIDE